MIRREDESNCCGVVTSIDDPFGQSTQFNYSAGRLTEVRDSAGRSTSFSYDGDGNLSQIQLPDPDAGITLGYDGEHKLTSWTNPEGDVTSFEYDCCQRISKVTTPEEESTQFHYPDDSSRVMIDALENTTNFSLDASGNITQVDQPQSISTTFGFDDHQRITAFTDGLGNTTRFEYDTMTDNSRRLASIQQPTGTFAFGYDPGQGRLTSVTDQNTNTTALEWDGAGNRTLVTDAASQPWTYGYNERRAARFPARSAG